MISISLSFIELNLIRHSHKNIEKSHILINDNVNFCQMFRCYMSILEQNGFIIFHF